ncbi:MAG: acyl-CoA/acyl-ACP dehydrogenase [Proteobacteria bacterium]|nr:acyl-CoA/acyl-ACP dehydrogenase [Pseudomonadota bacterium]
MDFALSEEQELLQETVRNFVERECPPTRVREVFDGETGHDPDLWKGLLEIGVGGLMAPESLGGASLGLLELALVAEELGRGAVPGPFLGHSLAVLAVALGGSPEQQRRWLPALARGDLLGTVALGEEGGRWANEEWTAEVRDGRVSGRKVLVPQGGRSDLVVLGLAGGGLAVVEAPQAGMRPSPRDGLDRGRRSDDLTLDGVRCEPLPGRVADRVCDAGRVLLAADAFGAAFQLVRKTSAYACTREQFGRPVAAFQAVKHQLANMALDVDPTRGLWWFAAHAFDALPHDAPRAAALAKGHVTERCMNAARAAVELHGGIGFTWECDVQIWFKRLVFDRVWLGTPARQRERVAALGGW